MKELKGSALVYILVIMTVVMILLTSIMGFVVSQLKYSMKQNDREQAFQIAEAGIHFYKWYLAHQLDGRTAGQVKTFWDAGTALGQTVPYVGNYENGQYTLTVTPPQTGETIVYIESTGQTTKSPEMKRTIRVRMRRSSWSENAVLTNEAVRFGAGTEVFGRIHSNGGIRFDGLAHNLVTSSASTYDDPDHNDHSDEFGVHTHVNAPPGSGVNANFRSAEALPNSVPARTDVFEAGREFPIAPIDFNGVLSDLNLMKSQAIAGTDGSRYFGNANQGQHIILNGTTFSVRTVRSFNASTNEINSYDGAWSNGNAIPNNGIIFVENNVWLEGIVNGKRVTVVAANLISTSLKTVYLGKNLRYTDNDCLNMIGVIGQNDVEIYRGSNDVLRLDAAFIAQNGRVGRANYTGATATRDVITIFGSISSNHRYGFAWADALGNHVSGYVHRNLYYDNNLLYCPPPYFPTGTQYQMDLWEEK